MKCVLICLSRNVFSAGKVHTTPWSNIDLNSTPLICPQKINVVLTIKNLSELSISV